MVKNAHAQKRHVSVVLVVGVNTSVMHKVHSTMEHVVAGDKEQRVLVVTGERMNTWNQESSTQAGLGMIQFFDRTPVAPVPNKLFCEGLQSFAAKMQELYPKLECIIVFDPIFNMKIAELMAKQSIAKNTEFDLQVVRLVSNPETDHWHHEDPPKESVKSDPERVIVMGIDKLRKKAPKARIVTLSADGELGYHVHEIVNCLCVEPATRECLLHVCEDVQKPAFYAFQGKTPAGMSGKSTGGARSLKLTRSVPQTHSAGLPVVAPLSGVQPTATA